MLPPAGLQWEERISRVGRRGLFDVLQWLRQRRLVGHADTRRVACPLEFQPLERKRHHRRRRVAPLRKARRLLTRLAQFRLQG